MQLQFFEYKEDQNLKNIRTVEIDGEIWFVAKDVCDVLGIQWKGNDTIAALSDNWKMTTEIADSSGRMQQTIIISEAGMYKFVFRSQKPNAEKFTNWIADDVLPSIRKTGKYGVTPIFVRRFNDNWQRVERGYFSIISELFIRVYGKLEQAGHLIPDKAPNGTEIRPDNSVGKTFPKWLEGKYPEMTNKFKHYTHLLPNNIEVEARQYENIVLPMFIEYIENDWLYNRAKGYFEPRDPAAINYLPKILEGKSATKKIN